MPEPSGWVPLDLPPRPFWNIPQLFGQERSPQLPGQSFPSSSVSSPHHTPPKSLLHPHPCGGGGPTFQTTSVLALPHRPCPSPHCHLHALPTLLLFLGLTSTTCRSPVLTGALPPGQLVASRTWGGSGHKAHLRCALTKSEERPVAGELGQTSWLPQVVSPGTRPRLHPVPRLLAPSLPGKPLPPQSTADPFSCWPRTHHPHHCSPSPSPRPFRVFLADTLVYILGALGTILLLKHPPQRTQSSAQHPGSLTGGKGRLVLPCPQVTTPFLHSFPHKVPQKSHLPLVSTTLGFPQDSCQPHPAPPGPSG